MAVIPRRLAILQALTAQLERVNPDQVVALDASGEPWDFRGHVHRGKLLTGAEVGSAYISVVEAPKLDPMDWGDQTKQTGMINWLLLVQGITDDTTPEEGGPDHPGDRLYWMQAAVEAVLARIAAERVQGIGHLYPDEYLLGLGGVIESIGIEPGTVRPPDGQQTVRAFFYVPLFVRFKHDVLNPYHTV